MHNELIATLVTLVGVGIGIVSLVYTFMRNFKTDVNAHIDRMDAHIEKISQRIDDTNKEMREENKKTAQRFDAMSIRMDGVYNLLLKKMDCKSE